MRHEEDEAVVERLLKAKRIAIVGLSDNPARPSYGVAAYLQRHGYDIVPVNPRCKEVLGVPAAAALAAVQGPIDLVNVFRRSEQCAAVAAEAIAVGAKRIWLQLGIRSAEARRLAQEAGIDYVEDRCIKIDHMMR